MNWTFCSFLSRFHAVFKRCLNASIDLLLNTLLFLNHGGVSRGLVPLLCQGSVPSWAMRRIKFSGTLWDLFDQMVKTKFFVLVLLTEAATLWKCVRTFNLLISLWPKIWLSEMSVLVIDWLFTHFFFRYKPILKFCEW